MSSSETRTGTGSGRGLLAGMRRLAARLSPDSLLARLILIFSAGFCAAYALRCTGGGTGVPGYTGDGPAEYAGGTGAPAEYAGGTGGTGAWFTKAGFCREDCGGRMNTAGSFTGCIEEAARGGCMEGAAG